MKNKLIAKTFVRQVKILFKEKKKCLNEKTAQKKTICSKRIFLMENICAHIENTCL